MKRKYVSDLLVPFVVLVLILTGCGADNSETADGGIIKTSSQEAIVQCTSCEGSGNCRVCDGVKECGQCHGKNKVNCYSCWGADICMNCGADGKMDDGRTCIGCKGSGKCNSNCENGYTDCNYCSKTGKCHACSGSGKCVTCDGKGEFDNTKPYLFYTKAEHGECGATGTVACENCSDGTCSKCGGEGFADCGMCKGLGKCNLCKGDPSSKYGGRCSVCGTTGKCKYCNDGLKACSTCGGLGLCKHCRGKHTKQCTGCIGGYRYNDNLVEATAAPSSDAEPVAPNSNSATTTTTTNSGFKAKCSYCSGRGYVDCPQCPGDGDCGKCYGRRVYTDSYLGNTRTRTCTRCNGSGKCTSCNGRGTKACTYCN